MTYDFPLIKNGRKLPIVVVGGCHNGIFSVTFLKTLFDGSDGVWTYHAYMHQQVLHTHDMVLTVYGHIMRMEHLLVHVLVIK